ncbi:MAG: tRNA dihydrouridine synthase DusB [Pseudomonadota bacterium]
MTSLSGENTVIRAVPPRVMLAPMAGITDRPFRALVAGFGVDLVVSEMVATQEMLSEKPSVRAKAEIAAGETATAVQIAGRDPVAMAEAARRLSGEGAAVIDLNFGCPAKKVTGGAAGSALMREPQRAQAIVEAVVEAATVPVSLKMRLGWDNDSLNAPEIARIAEGAGVVRLAVHGRTRAQFYKGAADWAAIARVCGATTLPVIANGDIASPEDARQALAHSKAQGVMIGRAAVGRPWLPAQIRAVLRGQHPMPAPEGRALATLIEAHIEAHLAFYGAEVGLRAFRKHLDAYCTHLSGARALRDKLVRLDEPSALIALIRAAIPDFEPARAA